MTFSVPPLPYEYDALEPFVDTFTMKEHHDFHHKAYVTGLNNATVNLQGISLTELISKTILDESLDLKIRTAIRNHGGGHYNHSLFWLLMNKESSVNDIDSELLELIKRDFTSLDKMKDEFNTAAVGVFGSGWVWLVLCDKKLKIITTPNQDNPLNLGGNNLPVLGLDVWEHAYYLQYQHERKKYVDRWWNVVDWKNVSKFFKRYAKEGKPIEVNFDGTIN